MMTRFWLSLSGTLTDLGSGGEASLGALCAKPEV